MKHSVQTMGSRDMGLQGAAFSVKDPGSAITHFIGFLYAIVLTPILLIHASLKSAEIGDLIGLSVFMMGMILLFGASTAYHTFIVPAKQEKVLKKFDHLMIFMLIAGSYTPVCLSILPETSGHILLTAVWFLAIAGMIFKFFWVTCPKWVSSVIYIGLGWSALFVLPQLLHLLPMPGFLLLLGGGLVYTIGGVIYAMKFRKLNSLHPNFGSHEIFHVCVMIGSLMHYLMMFLYVR